MEIISYKTRKVVPNDSLEKILDESLPSLKEGDIVAVTSKIISLCEGRVVAQDKVTDKRSLILQEADAVLDDSHTSKYGICLTIKNKLLLPTAGIDRSNAMDFYVLYPENIPASAAKIWDYLRSKHKVKNLGVLVTDSHTTPLRYGVTGIGIGWCGFDPLYSYIGKPDCFGHPLRVTKVNILDALAVPAVFVMGEGNEQTPLAILRDAPHITFTDHPPTAQERDAITIDLEDDLYGPILTAAKWIRKEPAA